MSDSLPTIRLYYLPQTFPCGVGSSCCGPVGQTTQDIEQYITALRKELGQVEVQTINVTGSLDPGRDAAAMRLLDSFGALALPIFALNGEVISMGPPNIDELVEILKGKFSAAT